MHFELSNGACADTDFCRQSPEIFGSNNLKGGIYKVKARSTAAKWSVIVIATHVTVQTGQVWVTTINLHLMNEQPLKAELFSSDPDRGSNAQHECHHQNLPPLTCLQL